MHPFTKQEVESRLTHGVNVVPLVRELPADLLTPVTAFLRLTAEGEQCFLLESVEGGQHIGRYTFLGTNPFAAITVSNGQAMVIRNDGSKESLPGNPFHAVGKCLDRYKAKQIDGLPRFCGGAVGTMGYEMMQYLEPSIKSLQTGEDPAHLMLFANIAAFDRLKHRMLLIANVILDGSASLDSAYANAVTDLDEMEHRLCRIAKDETARPSEKTPTEMAQPEPTWPKDDFLQGVKKLKKDIRNGEIFQAVLSMGYRLPVNVSPFRIYRCLRRLNPSPYTFYLDTGASVTLGASPEMLVRVEGRRVETRPIAGTRPRGSTDAEDRRRERHLLASPKERAEHVMLLDLGRNDIGRVAHPGTVEVPSIMRIERYSHVMHMVSSVTGRLRRGVKPWDALASCFPAGTVTGAPKIRAIELVAELEPLPRKTYAGCVVYRDFRGNLDSAIAIRSLSIERNSGEMEARVQAGAGIVADSSPSREYKEVEAKAGAVLDAIRMAVRGPQ